MPKITIVMPTYNQGKFIRQAIDSMLWQTFKDFLLIIVNDGATDDTEQIISSYSDPRIIYVKKPNGGTGSALNEGFKFANSPYEMWFSSDNILYPTALEEFNNYLDTHPDIDYVYGNIEIGVMDHTGLVEVQRKNIKDEIAQNWNPAVLQHHYFLGIAWLWRRELRVKAGPFQTEPCEDYYMVLEMERIGGRFAFLDKCLAWFRRHGENMSMSINKTGIDYSGMVRRKSAAKRQKDLIPKIAHFYWGGAILPYMRYLTIASFVRHNPDWRVKLYRPTEPTAMKSWSTHEHKYELEKFIDYSDLLRELPVESEYLAYGPETRNWPEVHKSDLLRWHLLSTGGGLWSDMDILYTGTMPEELGNFDTGVCICPEYGHSVGFLLASPLNDFYKDILRLAKLAYKADQYQCLGATLLNEHYGDMKAITRVCRGAFNIPMDIVYPYNATKIDKIFGQDKDLSCLTERTIGVHWYAGHRLAGEFQSGKIKDCFLSFLLKREGYNADF